MFRLAVGISVICAFLLLSAVTAFSEGLKIGYIDSERILAEYKAFADAQEKLEKFKREWEQEAAQKENELNRLRDEFEKQQLLLSEQKRAEMQREIESKWESYRQFVDEILAPDGKMAQKNMELSKPIFDKINEILQKIGTEENYDFIFLGAQSLAFAKPEYDLTQKVLDELNKEVE